MPKNSQYLLEKIIEIQNIVIEQQQRGVSQMWTYHNLIRPRFFISKGTFKNYLARNAKRELKELLASRQ
jgi:hypothetical protein